MRDFKLISWGTAGNSIISFEKERKSAKRENLREIFSSILKVIPRYSSHQNIRKIIKIDFKQIQAKSHLKSTLKLHNRKALPQPITSRAIAHLIHYHYNHNKMFWRIELQKAEMKMFFYNWNFWMIALCLFAL